ncbi:acyl-CoA synthetase [Rhodococcus opacus]|uniref:acyl-CoA synthetase n=1 Tax=Rhodococcus opacus TaxID=37919 RepID=UPI001C46AC89|nr:acyl-CoA synthetase [Rhodococcus opacus]MBV6754890.1 acyl-CoA synthetase [Rhodococcus opacus]
MYPGAYVHTSPDKPAVIRAETGQTITYAQLESRSARFARWMFEKGLRRGDHIAILSDNDPTVYELYWGAIRSGLYVTVVNNHLSTSELAYIIADCDAQVLVVSAALGTVATDLAGEVSGVRHRLAFGGRVPGFDDYAESVATVGDHPLDTQPRGAEMLYSSGTTGRPKGIKGPLPEREVGAEPGDSLISMIRGVYGFDQNTVYLSPAPVYHAAPLRYSVSTQALGGTVIMMDRFEPEACLAAIDRYGVTHSQWVPTHFIRMLRLPNEVRARYDVSTMRCAIHAAAPCPVEVKEAMLDWWGEILYEYYSASESYGITLIDSAEWRRKPGSVGRDGIRGTVHVCDGSDGPEVPIGEIGTIYFERDDWAFEYHKAPEKTAASRHRDHSTWTTVGDMGYVDSDRFLFLTDRATFMIISGGVNIYPQEVENCLTVHPKVLDVAVIGVPDAEMGEAVKAVVQPVPGVEPGPQLERELIAYARDRIAHFKCPRTVDFVSDLPRTPTGKLVKGALAKSYADR